MKRRTGLSLFLLVVLNISVVDCLQASDFGVTGLLDIPTARMANDGDLSLTISRQRNSDIYNLTYQATPWFETTFRYTIFNARHVNGLTDKKTDRSYEAKVRVLKEGTIRPQLVIGVRDVLGSGLWGSEYFVASKRFGHLDATIGIGWGRFSDRSSVTNPLELIDKRFGDRTRQTGGSLGGRLRSLSFFRGQEVGFLGGVSYSIPSRRMRILVEYNPDAYERQRVHNTLPSNSAWSYGLEWNPRRLLRFAISRQQGNQWALRFAAHINTQEMPKRKAPRAYYSSAEPRAISRAPDHLDLTSVYDRLLYDVERSGLLLRRANIRRDIETATFEISNERYEVTADAIHRFLTLAEAHIPQSIDTVSLVLNEGNFHPATIHYIRESTALTDDQQSDENLIMISPGQILDRPSNLTDYLVPNLGVELNLSARVQLMDPDKPLRHQIYARISARLKLREGWNIWATYGQNITNDFSSLRSSDSVLPRVRSDVNRYLTEGRSGIDSFYLEYRGGVPESLYYRAYGGILEEMFSGFGAELLFKPFDSRWAVGMSSNVIRQREYDRIFQLRDYRTTTAFVSIYYATPFYDFDVAIHAGRYLAKDIGMTYELRRTFMSGFSIGAFFTRTDTSDLAYGQGSFDKGLTFRIPFNAFFPNNTRSRYSTTIRSLERDGGRRLESFGSTLWWDLRPFLPSELNRHRSRMIPR